MSIYDLYEQTDAELTEANDEVSRLTAVVERQAEEIRLWIDSAIRHAPAEYPLILAEVKEDLAEFDRKKAGA